MTRVNYCIIIAGHEKRAPSAGCARYTGGVRPGKGKGMEKKAAREEAGRAVLRGVEEQKTGAYRAARSFLICVDSDGCVFDTMEIKHKECFCPAAIKHFSLQAVSKYARDAWDFVNLYSKWRGIHRVRALLMALDLLEKRVEVRARGFRPPRLQNLRDYVEKGGELSNAALEAHLNLHPEMEDIRLTLAWSYDVNRRIADMVHGIPPFPHVRETLEKAAARADIAVVSATEQRAVEREWAEHGVSGFARAIFGQESGGKREIISALAPHYPQNHVLMLGDAPGDRDAAHLAGALFYPICPDREGESWRALPDALEAFFGEDYAGEREKNNVRAFERFLPAVPAWRQTEDR